MSTSPTLDAVPKAYMPVAELFALLAHPTDDDRRSLAATNLRGLFARHLHVRLGEGAADHVVLGDLLHDATLVDRAALALEPLLRKRIRAGKIALPLILAAASDPPAENVPGIGKATISAMVEHFADLEGTDERTLRRELSDARPVLHLAAAYVDVLRTLRSDDDERMPDVLDFAVQPDLGLLVMRRAKEFILMMERSPALRSAAADVFRF